MSVMSVALLLASIATVSFGDGDRVSFDDDAADRTKADMVILTDSLNPLREHFNAHKDKHRFIAILSPT